MSRQYVSGSLHILTVAIISMSLAFTALPAASTEAASTDFGLVNGRFYTQTATQRDFETRGYAITNADSIPFWSTYQRLGGVDILGYPISRRFIWDGYICQALQRGVLQWHADTGQVQLVNTMDHLTDLGKDDYFARERHVPLPALVTLQHDGTVDSITSVRLGWLDNAPAMRTFFARAADPVATFGLPSSPMADVGPAMAMRFQRAVMYQWKNDFPWAKAGTITLANTGEFLKEAEVLPAVALEPEPAPPMRDRQETPRSAPRPDNRVSGVATWYGAYFHGRTMANGRVYNMWNPGTAAANIYPLGTRLRVTRVATGQSIVVTVTDRGAFRNPIIVDLSYAAFASLADPDEGVIRIIVEPLD